MSYTTQSDLITRFGLREIIEVTDEAGTGVVDDLVVARAIADADAEVDAWIGQRVTLPLAVVPAALGRVAADIARYYLWDDRAQGDGAGKAVAARYEHALAFLKGVARGDVLLGISADGSPAVAVSQAEAWTAGRRVARPRA
jgi:phage gp36-like protein